MQIRYQPFLGRTLADPGNQTVSIQLNLENLAGIALLASQITQPNQIQVTETDQTDLNQIIATSGHFIQYIDLTELARAEYDRLLTNPQTCILVGRFNPKVGILVRLTSLDFIQGAIYLCNLFGLNWSSYIRTLIPLKYDRYLGKIYLTQPVNILDLTQYLKIQQAKSLQEILIDCFESTTIGFFPQSNIYVTSTDSDYSNIIACAALTQSISGNYIYNVCTFSKYRGLGLMKSLLIALLNDFLGSSFYLFVDPKNKAAYKLYTSLSFVYIRQDIQDGKVYHLLRFN